MVAVPGAMPVTMPVPMPTVATAPLALAHVPPVVLLLRAVVLPVHADSVPVIVLRV